MRSQELGLPEGSALPAHRTRRDLAAAWRVTSTRTELVDGYDEEGRPIGRKTRAAVHRDGTWHRCVHCVIVYSEGPARRVVLQRRARTAVDYPGLIDVTVAGHLLAGESPTDAATREIREELGMDLPATSLTPLGDYRLVVETTDILARELTDVYGIRDGPPPDRYRCDPSEVASLVTVALADALDLWSGKRPLVTATEYVEGRVRVQPLALSDFVNEVPDYWPWLASVLIAMDGPT